MKSRIKRKIEKITRALRSRYDTQGSYTGNPTDEEKPQQDADDL